MAVSLFGGAKDILFMQEALEQARIAAAQQEVPIGAVIVNAQGQIIARAFNRVEQEHSQTAHAEIRAIEQVCAQQKDWRLNGCWLYVTLEPCVMCIGLIRLSRLAGVVYGASSRLFGFNQYMYTAAVADTQAKLLIIPAVLQQEAVNLLQQFFQEKRNLYSEQF